MKKIRKDNKVLLPRMNPMEERGQNNHLSAEAVPVWYSRSGKVNPEWLSACIQQRNLANHLMEQIADPLNLSKAYQRVLCNGGGCGVDGMPVQELQGWLGENLPNLREQLLQGTYKPQPLRGVQILKSSVGKRQLGIPTVIDRMIQQALHQLLIVDYERIFSKDSYGFRPNKNAHQAHYFRYASMKSKLESVDGWIRRKLKCFRLKQCKRTIGIVRWLRKLGVAENLSWRTALSGKGWQRLSNSPGLNIGKNNRWSAEQGFYSRVNW
jgi:hypothetical protein